MFLFILSFLLAFRYNCEAQNNAGLDNVTHRNFIYNTYEYDKIISVTVNETTIQTLDFTEESNKWRGYPSRVHAALNDTLDGEYPVFITATQQKGVSSWELPLVVATSNAVLQFDDMARTLCPHDAGSNITSENRPMIQITTANPHNTSVNIKLRRVTDFYVELDKEVPLNVTPSTPKYYYFSFDKDPLNNSHIDKSILPRFNYTIPKSVMLMIESDDTVCAVVSIQNNSCPVFDNEKDMLYQGYHLTMMTKGGIIITQSMFPVGFYIVFIVKENNAECTGIGTDTVSSFQDWIVDGRVKNFRFRVVPALTYTEYISGVLAAFALVLIVAIFAPLLTLLRCNFTEEITVIEDEPGPSSSVNAASSETQPIAHIDDSDSEVDLEAEKEPMPQEIVLSPPLTLAGLSRAKPGAHSRRSDRYFWSALTVAVVYALPVVQLLSTYQRMVFQTGNQDLCYYNFLCAHPLGFLSDFNHVYSNVGYVLLGLVFMAQTWWRQIRAANHPKNLGIPQHHGLFYSMGLALTMEGLLSACYHLCPNKMNFQFDSSFMYVIAVLVMVKLYQNRHPDVNASAHSTFMLIAVAMFIGYFGITYPSVAFWIVFTILHLYVCFVLTMKIYYVGRFRMECLILKRAWVSLRTHGRRTFLPSYTARALLLAVANVANWALAAYGMYSHNKDFARHLLAILMGNAILYMLSYVLMKLVHRELIPAYVWVQLALAHAAWVLALLLFLDSRTKWSETPAQSRQHNAACTALRLLDTHDLWHLASAAAMFLSFNALLAIDDPLVNTPRHLIPVF
ncbi:SID1 transmembrane family member 1 [Papilio machaon]|uniref:SID1 transmembrane family member 1 n=1 Tax=Papilio machaon TaxID=76193 RepID=UPI001E66450A|nr:SID1 transmembrane family member 1 [Papilio machaon]